MFFLLCVFAPTSVQKKKILIILLIKTGEIFFVLYFEHCYINSAL